MSFTDDMNRISTQIEARTRRIFVNVASAAHESIVNGSPVTGAPGQPVDTGNLRNSWHLDYLAPDVAEITTNVEYAPIIEDNLRGVHFHNHGAHSVKLTIAGIDRIIAVESAKAGVNV